jgi:hypothetical protein
MDSFEEFMNSAGSHEDDVDDNLIRSPGNILIENLEINLSLSIIDILFPAFNSTKKSQEFAEDVSKVISSNEFISELSDKIGLPLESETEDEFVERSSEILRKMLYSKFGIKD